MNVMKPSVMNGLNTDTFKVKVAGIHTIYAESTVNFGSGLVITLSQTGSTSVSASTPATSPQQECVSINNKFNCAVGDILSVVTSSSANADQPASIVKTTINLRMGI